LLNLQARYDLETLIREKGAAIKTRVWARPNPGCQKDVMSALADMGERMGADPSSWRTELP
jgi:hypothetical protein